MLTPGQVIDRYVVVQELGGGATAQVYLVEHRELGTRLALKVMTLAGARARERALLEGRTQASLDHPNLVTVRDVLPVGECPALLMDYVDGPAMDTLLDRYRPSLAQVDHLTRQILAGVEHAHDRGLVHRDLKPANILVQVDEDGVVPRVTDFGLVKILEPGADSLRTRTGAVLGTPMYMAPEQIRSAAHVDARADVFALGCVLYRLLCGAPAFAGADLIQLHERMTTSAWRPVREWVPAVPRRMERAIARALEPDPEQRPRDASELLQLWIEEATETPGAAVWESEHRAILAAMGPGAGGPTPGVSKDTSPTLPPPAAPSGPASETLLPEDLAAEPGGRPILAVVAVAAAVVLLGVGGLTLLGGALAWSVWTPPPASTLADSLPPAPPSEPQDTAVEEVEDVAAVLLADTSPPTATSGTSSPPSHPTLGTEPPANETPRAPVPRRTRWSVSGVASAWLVGPSGVRLDPGPVPAGRYRVEVLFDGADRALPVMTLDLAAGESRHLTCTAALKGCR